MGRLIEVDQRESRPEAWRNLAELTVWNVLLPTFVAVRAGPTHCLGAGLQTSTSAE
jgi:hypothetical protein